MIPDEKKAMPWGLPPLRSEAILKQRQQQQQQKLMLLLQEGTACALTSSAEKQSQPSDYYLYEQEKRSQSPVPESYSVNYLDDHTHAHTKGYTSLLPQQRHTSDIMSMRKRMAIFGLGMSMMAAAVLYIRFVMYDPRVIDPGTFSPTTLGTNPDTLEAVTWLLDAGFDEGNTVAWDRLAEMTDMYGNRMTASKGYDLSAQWVVRTIQEQDKNLTAYTEPVWVNDWQRGHESLVLYVPTRPGGQVDIPLLGLGNSVGTPSGGIEANVVPVHSFEELRKLGNESIAGHVVLYNYYYTDYGTAVKFRSRGAVEAEKFGAVGVLVRTVAPDTSFDSIHTGSSARASIPAASISAADANLIERLYRRSQSPQASSDHLAPRIRLSMEAQLRKDAKQSDNIIVDFPGTEKSEEVVLLSGHFDSWDVGVGAMDDGAGAFVSWEAARLIALNGRRPRRTIRVVMWNNEETLQRGARAYFEKHREEIHLHKFAIESDIGVFEPWGLTVQADKAMTTNLRNYGVDLIKILGAGNVTTPEVEGPGEDIRVLCDHGVPCAGLLSLNPENGAVPGDDKWTEHYFRYHHASSDRMEVIDKHQLRRSAAALAAWAYLIADLP
ncbi:hypothetical protein GGF37_002133 [Kickxella alabastrina]|nr:hypothetical protein GGF37_002133 [Kickxella alabastrina]